MATLAAPMAREQSFYAKMALGLAIFILFAFGQFAARGFVDVGRVPVIVHVHALAMTAWLAVLVVQATLAGRMDMRWHRRIGWSAMLLVVAIPPLAIGTCVTMLRLGAVPPFFAPAAFLSLVVVESLTFAALVFAAVALRRRTAWHRRLMLGSTLILLEPALGRLLPMPLLGIWGEWLAMLFQLGAAAIIARHDLATRGRMHEATMLAGAAIVFTHVLDTALAAAPPVQAMVAALA